MFFLLACVLRIIPLHSFFLYVLLFPLRVLLWLRRRLPSWRRRKQVLNHKSKVHKSEWWNHPIRKELYLKWNNNIKKRSVRTVPLNKRSTVIHIFCFRARSFLFRLSLHFLLLRFSPVSSLLLQLTEQQQELAKIIDTIERLKTVESPSASPSSDSASSAAAAGADSKSS